MQRCLLISGTLGLLIICSASLNTIADDPIFIWPADAVPGVTSSFGEWRSGHIHAGVDVKTWGRIGVPMLAVGDGYVQRIRTSPWGYGKALYLILSDGRIVVYAHLDRFAEQLEDIVWEHQNTEGRYSVDFWLQEDEYPVKVGDIIAYSGDTGSGAPHLHFELRDKNNVPVNPLLHGLRIDDNTAPIPQFLLFRPTGSESRVEWDVQVRRFGIIPKRGGGYRLRNRPEIEGSFCIAIAAYDLMDGVWNRFSPYRFLMQIDGQEEFSVSYDQFSYNVSNLINLDRDYRYMVREGVRAHTLYRMTGNELPFYGEYDIGAGYLDNLEPGIHQIVITVGDASGNESRIEGEILINRAPQLNLSGEYYEAGITLEGQTDDPDGDTVELTVEFLSSDEPAGKWSVVSDYDLIIEEGRFNISPDLLDSLSAEGGWMIRVRAQDAWGRSSTSKPIIIGDVPESDPGSPVTIELTVETYEGFLILYARLNSAVAGTVDFNIHQGELLPVSIEGEFRGNNLFRAFYPLQPVESNDIEVTARFHPPSGSIIEVSAEYRIYSLPTDSGLSYISSDEALHIDFPSGSVYENSFVQDGGTFQVDDNEKQALIVLSDVYDVGPQDILFRQGAELTIDVNSIPDFLNERQVDLYTHNGSENYGRWVSLGGELEDGVLRARIGGLGPFAVLADTSGPDLNLISPRHGRRLRNNKPTLTFEIDDNASGISEETQIVLRLNGKQVIARYEPQHDRLIYIPRDPLEPGDYWILLEVTDNAGNTNRVNSTFTILGIE